MLPNKDIFRHLPLISWLAEASPRTDIVAGVALAGLLVPQGMAYAGIAGVRPEMGLYAASAGMFVYAILGTSRHLAVTTTSSAAAMLSALISPLALDDSPRYCVLASGAAVTAGLIFLAGGFLRLGSVSEFISKPVLKGFVFGLALTIMVKQGHKMMGISSGQGTFFHQSWHVLTSLHQLNPWTLAVGTIALAVMLILERLAPRVPSALVVLVLGTLAVPFFHLYQRGVEVVGTIHAGMPSLKWPKVSEDEVADLFVGTIGIVLVLMAESLAAARTFAAKYKYEINPNQELRAIGVSNIVSGLVGGIIVGGGMSGTAANVAGGARSRLATLTASVCVGLTLAFLLPFIRNLPQAVLAAIVVHAVAHLADVGAFRYYARLGTGSLWVALTALLAVLQMGILKGLIFAVGLTLILLMWKLSKPQDSVLGRLTDSQDFVDVTRYPEARQVPGLLIFRPNGILFFANANRVRNRLRELIKQSDTPIRMVLINLEAAPEVDITSLEMMRELADELHASGISLSFSGVPDRVRDLFLRSRFLDRLGQHSVFGTTGAAVNAFQDTTLSAA